MVVELLRPVRCLTSKLVATNCLDTLLESEVPACHRENSHLEINPGVHKHSFRMFLKDVNKLCQSNTFSYCLQPDMWSTLLGRCI